MHFLLGLGALALLIGFAFGEVFARAFVGTVLGLVALGTLLFVGSVLWDLNEIDKAERASVVRCVARGVHLDRCGVSEAEAQAMYARTRTERTRK